MCEYKYKKNKNHIRVLLIKITIIYYSYLGLF